jgi:chromosome segregation ATPase
MRNARSRLAGEDVVYSPHMAQKKSAKPPKATLDKILSTMERGFASSDRKFTALAEDIADIKAELKGDITALGGQLTGIEGVLKEIRRDLDDLQDKFENVSGFRKEIDHALKRIAAIEKHLGINKKIAA